MSTITSRLFNASVIRVLRTNVCSSLGVVLFRNLLFPVDFSSYWDKQDLLWAGGLIYNETTRLRLNDIVLKLVGRDLDQLKLFFVHLDGLVPCTPNDPNDDAGLFPIIHANNCSK